MAKKKNQSKKHKFKYSEPTSGVTARETQEAPVSKSSSATTPSRQPAAVAVTRDFSYVFSDLRRVAVLVGSLVALELVLWYLLGHTGVGDTVYNLVRI